MPIDRPHLYSVRHWIYHILVITVLLALLSVSALAEAFSSHDSPRHYYGAQSLNPMMMGGKTIVYLPGGTELVARGDEDKYSLTDHLQSTRLAVKTDGSVSNSIDYTPFGDTQTSVGAVAEHYYTGMVFEPETNTYNYHARNYHPSVGRFDSVDSIRQSISPYSYTANNPINNTDPNGRGKIHFLLFSQPNAKYSEHVSGIENSMTEQLVVTRYDFVKGRGIAHPELTNPDNSIGNISINFNLETIRNNYGPLGPESSWEEGGIAFADLIASNFHRYNNSQAESFVLRGYGPREGRQSFAEAFGQHISRSRGFTGLKKVYINNYEVKTVPEKDSGSVYLDVFSQDKIFKLRFKLNADAYYSGNLPPELTKPIDRTTPFELYAKISGDYKLSRPGINTYKTFDQPVFSNNFRRPPPKPPTTQESGVRVLENPLYGQVPARGKPPIAPQPRFLDAEIPRIRPAIPPRPSEF